MAILNIIVSQSVLCALSVCSDVGHIPANYVQLVNSQNIEQYE